MAEIQACDSSVWEARAARARRIADMLVGRDAEIVLAYARECEEHGQSASSNIRPTLSLVPVASGRAAPLISGLSSARTRAA